MLYLKETKETPLVIASTKENFILLRGRSHILDALTFYKPLIEMVDDKDLSMSVEVDLLYYNTTTTKVILKLLSELNEKSTIKWYFDDQDEYEYAYDLQDLTDLNFIFEKR